MWTAHDRIYHIYNLALNSPPPTSAVEFYRTFYIQVASGLNLSSEVGYAEYSGTSVLESRLDDTGRPDSRMRLRGFIDAFASTAIYGWIR
jgi:hypothetical protein